MKEIGYMPSLLLLLINEEKKIIFYYSKLINKFIINNEK